jgi:hypothetical protein
LILASVPVSCAKLGVAPKAIAIAPARVEVRNTCLIEILLVIEKLLVMV